MHWWGAAAGIGALAVASVGAPSAFAAHRTPPKPVVHSASNKAPAAARPGRVEIKRNDRDRWYGHPGHWNPHCAYPPHGRPDVAISGQHWAKVHSTIAISGLMTVNKCGYENQKAGLYKLVQVREHGKVVKRWRPAAAPKLTDAGGKVSFTVTVDRKSSFRIITAPNKGLAPGISGPLAVSVRGFDEKDRHHFGHR